MYVRHLSVTDFRSWPKAELELPEGPSVLVGSNGQGKTNLVEALGYLATLSSHRVAQDAPLVRAGAAQATVQAAVVSSGRQLLVEIDIIPGRANKARLNRGPVTRPRDILGAVRSVLFAPEDLAIVRGDPGERRRFLDELLVQQAPRLAGVRSDYERILKQRSTLLKSAGAARRGSRSVDLRTLDVWDAQLAQTASVLLVARWRLLDELSPLILTAYREVASASSEITAGYVSSLGEGFQREPGEQIGEPVVEAAILNELARRRNDEIDRGVCLVGPHRDDVLLSLDGLPVKGYASHGEAWSTALSLRLASFELLRSGGEDPVLILDDVFAELDTQRRDRLAVLAGKAEQVLVTAAVPSDVPEALSGGRFDVFEGQVRRVR